MRAAVAIIVAVIVLTACGPEQWAPEPVNAEIATPAGADEAWDLLVVEWEARVGASHAPGDTVPLVRWYAPVTCTRRDGTTGPCIQYLNLRDPDLGPVQVASMYWPYNAVIDVTAIKSDRPSGSGLTHEALSWILASSGRCTGMTCLDDADSAIYQQVNDVRAILMERGL